MKEIINENMENERKTTGKTRLISSEEDAMPENIPILERKKCTGGNVQSLHEMIDNLERSSYSEEEIKGEGRNKISKQEKNKQMSIRHEEEESNEECDETEYQFYRMKPRRSIDWTIHEIEALNEGYQKYGNSWSKTLKKFSDVFNDQRRIVDLKLKHDSINRNSSYYKTNIREWVVIDEMGVKKDALGEELVIKERFPFDAAKKFAKSNTNMSCYLYILTIAEKGRMEGHKHSYEVENMANGDVSLRKVRKYK
ncbi:hypothetical protein NUSPORA_01268 [Nucleospora cyclopteri]